MRLHSFVLDKGDVLLLPDGAPHVVIEVGPQNVGGDPDDVGGVRARAMWLEHRVRLARAELENRMRQRARPIETEVEPQPVAAPLWWKECRCEFPQHGIHTPECTARWRAQHKIEGHPSIAEMQACPVCKDAPWLREALKEPVDVPITSDFWAGVRREVEYQRQKWSTTSDAGKTHADWFWLIGYLAGKALYSALAGNTEKALHHTISTAAACANWHAAITGEHTGMRPGIEPPEGEAAP